MNRHLIIRAAIAILWLVIGIIQISKGASKQGVLSFAIAVAFAASAAMLLLKKNK